MRRPPIIQIVTPAAAAYLFGVSDTRLRRLALDGRIPYLIVRTTGRKPTRAYSFAACVERWGDPDPDRLTLLLRLSLTQLSDGGAATFDLITTRPWVENADGGLATSMESNK